LYTPIAQAFDSAGNLFVSDAHGNAIYEYAPDGTRTTFATGLAYPAGLAFDSRGYLFEADEDSFRILKFAPDGTQSNFVTALNDPVGLAFDSAGYLFATNYVTGVVYKFAPDGTSSNFATVGTPIFIAVQPPAATASYAAQIQQPINPDGTSVFSVRRGVIPEKFTLTQGGVPTCALPPATIAVTRTAGGTIGDIDEAVYTGAADNGSNFRIDSCQYIYNLNSSALGVGTYRVDIKINGQVVGSGVFALR
jgi:hypothetical protein